MFESTEESFHRKDAEDAKKKIDRINRIDRIKTGISPHPSLLSRGEKRFFPLPLNGSLGFLCVLCVFAVKMVLVHPIFIHPWFHWF